MYLTLNLKFMNIHFDELNPFDIDLIFLGGMDCSNNLMADIPVVYIPNMCLIA